MSVHNRTHSSQIFNSSLHVPSAFLTVYPSHIKISANIFYFEVFGMYTISWAVCCLTLLLSAHCTHATPVPDVSAPLSPLYVQDPHDVQSPSYPPPTCSASQDRAFDIGAVISTNGAIMDFCTTQTDSISANSWQPISGYYFGGKGKVVRLSLSWDNTGTCPTNRTTHSPSDNSGRGCKTMFRDIVLGCEYFGTF